MLNPAINIGILFPTDEHSFCQGAKDALVIYGHEGRSLRMSQAEQHALFSCVLSRATKIQARYPDILVSMPEYKALIPFDAICNFITGRNLFTRTADLPNNILMYLTPPSLLVNQR